MNLLKLALPWWVPYLCAAAAVASIWWHGRVYQMDIQERERDANQIEFLLEGDRHVQSYHRKVAELGDVRDTADKLRGLCRKPPAVHRPGVVTPTPGGDAGDRRADQEAEEGSGLDLLALDLHSAQRNKFRCQELISLVKKQATKKRAWWDPRGWGED